ncbi:MAG: uL15 family ribosomal protein [Candidatus Aenigmarchaeota archaeon]|nr:uL15 family ribosomal protein [Candidatus Aenigmarchaeota archaeon]
MAKRKKVIKMRGSKTHGYGSKKKHRGSGSRGGKGQAGQFKHKKTFFKRWGKAKQPRFKSLEQRNIRAKEKTINLGDLVKLTDKSEIDAAEFGYGKVLSEGVLEKPVTIKAKKFSERAKEKIEKAGGKAVLEE